MDNPSWADILAADSALWASIFAGFSFVATVIGVVVAYKALGWAKKAAEETAKAAKEAGIQATAALASVDVAREQIALLEKEMEWNEPQPILFLAIYFSNPYNGPGGSISIKNVGGVPAFDVQIEPISVVEVVPKISVKSFVRFYRMPVLDKGETLPATPMPPEKFLSPCDTTFKLYATDLGVFLKTMIDVSANQAQVLTGDRTNTCDAGKIAVAFASARGATFRQEFKLAVSGGNQIECYPFGSLVRDRIKTNDAATARDITLREVGY